MPESKVRAADTLPTTEALLVSDGDARIALDPLTGLNKYGCPVVPDPDLLDFASSTATVISEAGFAAAWQLREIRLHQSGTESLDDFYAREMQRIREALLMEVADLNPRLIFAVSGTDAHFMIARYVARSTDRPLWVLMVEEAETGSGVAAALSASFDAPADRVHIDVLPLRTSQGAPRPPAEIDTDASARVQQAIASGRHVLLVMVDQSKTGMIAPSPACVMQLHRRHPDQLSVLVDACQFRLAKDSLRAYLQQGFMVALTGSKFFTGPSFSAALLLPQGATERAGLRAFPRQTTTNGAPEAVQPDFTLLGLLLRWEAARVEIQRFRAFPQAQIRQRMAVFAEAIQQRLNDDPHFEPLFVPPLDRRPLVTVQSWDQIQSIFPFVLYRLPEDCGHAERIPLSREETLQIYRQLQVSEGSGIGVRRCRLGQPVVCGSRAGVEVSALRLCLSARQICDAAGDAGLSGVIDDALVVLDKTAWLIDKSVGSW